MSTTAIMFIERPSGAIGAVGCALLKETNFADRGGVRVRRKEQDIQRAVLDHLAWRGRPGMFAFHPANGGWRSVIEAAISGLRYTASVGRFPDGRIGELFISNHKINSHADTNARDAAIVFSIAVQCGADPETIRRALCRDS